jgi:hypothetical protein
VLVIVLGKPLLLISSAVFEGLPLEAGYLKALTYDDDLNKNLLKCKLGKL